MKLILLWIITRLLDLTYPYGIVPLILCTWIVPWLVVLWMVLGICGFIFGYRTWKHYVSRRDRWEKGEMGMVDYRMSMALLRLREFCYFGATVVGIFFLYCALR